MWENFFEVLWWVIWPWSVWGCVIWFGYSSQQLASQRGTRIAELEKNLAETKKWLANVMASSEWKENDLWKTIKELRNEIRQLEQKREQDVVETAEKVKAAKHVSIDSILGLRPEKKAKSRGA